MLVPLFVAPSPAPERSVRLECRIKTDIHGATGRAEWHNTSTHHTMEAWTRELTWMGLNGCGRI